jgi:nitroimidazol reductase NimA-like FMN-containing flavoprotein (pyridoxamine 5'-phosphate oxidase superfamily)
MPSAVSGEAEALLTGEPLVGHLATSHEDRPHCSPVWFVYRDGRLELVTTGRKLRDIRRNPRVAFSLERSVDGDPQWGLSLHGTATVVEAADEARSILHRVNRRYGVDEDAWAENTAVRVDIGSVAHWRY